MFRKLVTLDEARRILAEHFKPRPTREEEVPLIEACGRVLAEDVIASLDIPPFSRSTVDGFAVRSEDTFGADEDKPIELRVCGTASIGERPKVTVSRGCAAEIVTGAPMPDGADAVVMVEHTERKGENVLIFNAVAKRENVMAAASDIEKGETVLKADQVLGSPEIGVLAALGKARVKVHAVPRVAVLSTGPEVTEPGSRLSFGKIYDTNAYSISAAVTECGGLPVYMGVFPDSLDELRKALKTALDRADVVVTSGGVSVGPKDVMPEALKTLGDPGVIVSGIAVKPGKPTTIASIEGKPIFSLPGHPSSALLMFSLLVRPMILGMAGRKPESALNVGAVASARMFSAKGRRTFVMVRLKREEHDQLVAEPVESGLSGAITTLAKADGYVEIPENQQFVDEGEKVTVHLLRNVEATRPSDSERFPLHGHVDG